MTIEEILQEERRLWGASPQSLEHITACLAVIIGDIARQAREKYEGGEVDTAELQKELGNLITSAIRWCDDLGIDPQLAIEAALLSQKNYKLKTTDSKV